MSNFSPCETLGPLSIRATLRRSPSSTLGLLRRREEVTGLRADGAGDPRHGQHGHILQAVLDPLVVRHRCTDRLGDVGLRQARVLAQLADAAADASEESRFFLVVVLRRHA